jgi:anti-anti-sigma factor
MGAAMPERTFKHLDCRKEGGILVITLLHDRIQGDEVGDAVRSELLAALDQFGTVNIVIDFRHVQYLSTAGFRPLLSLHRKLQELRGRMIFCNLSPETEDVFVVTRLISNNKSSPAPFEKADNLEDALARFRHHTCRMENGILVIRLTETKLQGEELADSLNSQLLETVSEERLSQVVLDLTPVEFVATACLRPVLNLRNTLVARGGRLVVCGLRPQVAEVLTATRLIASGMGGPVPLETAPNLPEALATLKH